MKNSSKFFTIIVGLLAILVSCKKTHTDPPKSALPVMQGITAVVNADGSVTLTGILNSVPNTLKVYGFELGPDSIFQFNLVYENATAPAVAGPFKVNITTGILPNTKYYYTPFYTNYESKNPFGFYPSWFSFNVKSFTTAP